MVPASSLHGVPRPFREPWLWKRTRRVEPRDLAGFLLAAAFHVGVLGLALVAPKSHLADRFWVPVEPAVDVEVDRIPAAVAPVPPVPEVRASDVAAGTLPEAPFVRAAENRARREKALSALTNLAVEQTPSRASARSEYDGPPPPLPLSSSPLSLLVPFPGPEGIPGSASAKGSTQSAANATAGKGAVEGQGQSPPKRAIDRAIATRLLAESLGQHDKALGFTLPAAGNVASALQSAVRTALGPAAGSATFLAILTPSGQILAISPIATNGASADAWASAAQAAAASLAGRTFSMVAPFQNGAVVWVDVTSTFVLPSGAAAPVSGEPGGIRFDLSDIGRRKQQVVHTRVRVAAVK